MQILLFISYDYLKIYICKYFEAVFYFKQISPKNARVLHKVVNELNSNAKLITIFFKCCLESTFKLLNKHKTTADSDDNINEELLKNFFSLFLKKFHIFLSAIYHYTTGRFIHDY